MKPLRLTLPLLVACCLCWGASAASGEPDTVSKGLPAQSSEGGSSQLKATVIVPSLDTPIEDGENVVWCASMPLLWKTANEHLQGAKLSVSGNSPLIERLDNAADPTDDIRTENLYVNAGFTSEGIAGRIRDEMARRFPGVEVPDFSDVKTPDTCVGYAYLNADVKFTTPYFARDIEWQNSDPAHKGACYRSFGLGYCDDSPTDAAVRKAIRVVYCSADTSHEVTDCALCLDSNPKHDRVVVAYMNYHGSLAWMLRRVKMATMSFGTINTVVDNSHRMRAIDTLNVPMLNGQVMRRFSDLAVRKVTKGGPKHEYTLDLAQGVRFAMTESGAKLGAQNLSNIPSVSGTASSQYPHHFDFNRPFLLYIEKPGASEPYFVMWVDNTELFTAAAAK